MKSVPFLAIIAAGILSLGAIGLKNASDADTTAQQPIDRIIGDGEYNALYPVRQSSPEEHHRQYVARVTKVVELLASRDVSDMPQELREARALGLKRLLEYRDRGIFATNYDYPGQFLPCFIDRNGAICAAGYLMQQSAGQEFVEQINREYKYATIHQMRSEKLDNWIATSGFTKAEIATIQVPSPDGRGVGINLEEMGIAVRTQESVIVAPTPVVEPTPVTAPPAAVGPARPAPEPAVDANISEVPDNANAKR